MSRRRYAFLSLLSGGLAVVLAVGMFVPAPAQTGPATRATTQPAAVAETVGEPPEQRPDLIDLEPSGANQPPREIRIVVGEEGGLEPRILRVAPGRALEIALVNESNRPHELEVVIPGRDPTTDAQVAVDQEQVVQFRAPARPGTYTFYCPIGDHREQGELGTMVVGEVPGFIDPTTLPSGD